MLSPVGKIFLALAVAATAFLFLHPLVLRYRIIQAGHRENRSDRPGRRTVQALGKVLLQRCTLKNERPLTGLMHVCIFYGALTFDTLTVNHTIEGFFSQFSLLGHGRFRMFFSALADIFAVLVLAGVAFFIVRRFIVRPKAYRTTPLDSALIYAFLILVTASYLYYEAFAIVEHGGARGSAFLGNALADSVLAAGFSPGAITAHYQAGWWIHLLLVFAFIAYVPHSKYLHMFAGSLNMFVRKPGSSREIPTLDLEGAEVFGLEKAADFGWKDNLDAFACMECGRCQDVCPAFRTDKPLSPKMILFDMEKNLLAERDAVIARNRDAQKPLVPGVHAEDEIWSCTTCGACQHVCPVEIEHIRKIVGMRQSLVLMESKFPAPLNGFFRNLETNANPWGIGFSERGRWADGLNVPTLAEHPKAEYFFWVGCAGSYDDEGRKTAQAFARLLSAAGVDFAILGPEEKCCGDSARRLGNEYLFQTLAAEAIETLARYKVLRILTVCPHGYNTFKNEYPRLSGRLPSLSPEAKDHFPKIEVRHHSEFLAGLISSGRLKPERSPGLKVAFHDPCYLGRHNGLVEAPRAVLRAATGAPPLELCENREHSLCCGAGGGLMWTEEILGTRVNHLRAGQVLSSGATDVATSCPFCLTMLRDGLRDKGRADIGVRDIAQILARSLGLES
ncbi:MAG: 4Fe-4S dicluster domain-containing protein [Candidatus Aminicenantes bacterium]|nr:4Fe-4S dicluster domain-containing protein [Candidatus Aminicenantes bacterium]